MDAKTLLACTHHHVSRVNRGENTKGKGGHDSSGRARSLGLLHSREHRNAFCDASRLVALGDRQYSVDGAGNLARRLWRSPLLRE